MQWFKPVVFVLALACFGSHATAQILIGEVDAFGTLTDALGEEEDWIEVWNAGDQAASLEGLSCRTTERIGANGPCPP